MFGHLFKPIFLALAILTVATSLSIADELHVQNELLVETGKSTTWKYSANKSAADWNQADYDVSQWAEGPAPLKRNRTRRSSSRHRAIETLGIRQIGRIKTTEINRSGDSDRSSCISSDVAARRESYLRHAYFVLGAEIRIAGSSAW